MEDDSNRGAEVQDQRHLATEQDRVDGTSHAATDACDGGNAAKNLANNGLPLPTREQLDSALILFAHEDEYDRLQAMVTSRDLATGWKEPATGCFRSARLMPFVKRYYPQGHDHRLVMLADDVRSEGCIVLIDRRVRCAEAAVVPSALRAWQKKHGITIYRLREVPDVIDVDYTTWLHSAPLEVLTPEATEAEALAHRERHTEAYEQREAEERRRKQVEQREAARSARLSSMLLADAGRLQMANVYALLSAGPRPDYVIEDLLVDGGKTAIFSPPGGGKSALAASWIRSVALGRPWCGRQVRQGTVVVLALENGRGMAATLFAGLNDADAATLKENLVLITEPPLLVSPHDPGDSAGTVHFHLDEWATDLGRVLNHRELDVALVVVDTWTDLLRAASLHQVAGESDALRGLNRLQAHLGGSLLITQHVTVTPQRDKSGSKLAKEIGTDMRKSCDVMLPLTVEGRAGNGVTVRVWVEPPLAKWRHRAPPEKDLLLRFEAVGPGHPLQLVEQLDELHAATKSAKRGRPNAAAKDATVLAVLCDDDPPRKLADIWPAAGLTRTPTYEALVRLCSDEYVKPIRKNGECQYHVTRKGLRRNEAEAFGPNGSPNESE